MSANKVILHIDMNAFFASCEEANNPSLRNKPMVVAGLTKRSIISSPNYIARSYGIKAAMPIFQAKRLCPTLTIVKHHFNLYQEYSEKFIKILTTKICNKIEYLSMDECYMDITSLVNDKTRAIDIAKRIQTIVKRELGIGTSIGISYNKFLAKMGSDYKKPMGITELWNEDQIASIIWPQPIGNMYFVGKSSGDILMNNKIKTIKDLAQCEDYSLLESVFGKNWKSFKDNANGIGDDELNYSYGDPKSISVSRTLLEDSNDLDEIKFYLKEFSKEISRRLRNDAIKAKTLVLIIKTPNFKTYTKSLTINKFIDDSDELYANYLSMYETYYSGKMLRLIGAGVSHLDAQDDLFSSGLFKTKKTIKTQKHINELDEIVNKINSKFSKDIIRVAKKQEYYQ